MNNDTTQSWLKFLNPVELKQNLIRCSIFIAAWELLKEAVVDPILWFYTDGFHGEKYSRLRYHQEVMELDTREKKDVVQASCLWLRKNNVIDDTDMKMIADIRVHRNFVAHEMTKVLGSAGVQVNLGLLDNLIEILGKIDRWWITEVEIPSNPDFTAEDLEKIDHARVFSMRMMSLQLIAKVAYGDDQSLAALYEEFKKRTGSTERGGVADRLAPASPAATPPPR
jgi:hypothetical protein